MQSAALFYKSRGNWLKENENVFSANTWASERLNETEGQRLDAQTARFRSWAESLRSGMGFVSQLIQVKLSFVFISGAPILQVDIPMGGQCTSCSKLPGEQQNEQVSPNLFAGFWWRSDLCQKEDAAWVPSMFSLC